MSQTRSAGVWIDRSRAVIVRLRDGDTGPETSTETFDSELEGHLKLAGGSRSVTPYGPQDVADEPGRERRYRQHLEAYMDRIASRLATEDSVLVFGPADAKLELAKAFERSGHRDRIVAIETADKMTDPQVAAYVRTFFSKAD